MSGSHIRPGTGPSPHERLHAEWRQVTADAGITADAAAAMWDELVRRHAEPHRHYHTLDHIADVVERLVPHRESFEHPAAVVLAAMFHDCVYSPRSRSNEHDSAQIASAWLQDSAVPKALIDRVRELIQATATHMAETASNDAYWLLDADLAVLGTLPDDYLRYARAIRAEYSFVPDADYATGRSAVLASFLKARQIYRTAPFQELEWRARENLTREIASLSGGGPADS